MFYLRNIANEAGFPEENKAEFKKKRKYKNKMKGEKEKKKKKQQIF